jgi:hypothetical protein
VSYELGFQHGGRGWKSLDKTNVIEISELVFKIVKENEILMPHP